MAERQSEKLVESFKTNGCDDITLQNKVLAEDVHTSAKRPPSRSPSPAPPQKSPCGLPPRIEEGQGKIQEGMGVRADNEEGLRVQVDSLEGLGALVESQEAQTGAQGEGPALSPRSRRKSWRRSARLRRSFPALPSDTQGLCRTISLSLQEEERLEKLIEASKQLAVQKLQDTLTSTPGASLEHLQTQVEALQKEWCSLAQNIRGEVQSQPPETSTDSDPGLQKSMDQIRKSVHKLQTECGLWESLLHRHRSKAEELARRVEQARVEGVTVDPASVAQSSQSKLILSKPDYHSALLRQQTVLHTMELLMDCQCKMVRELLSFQEQSHILVKETSARLASRAGFQALPSSPVRKLLTSV